MKFFNITVILGVFLILLLKPFFVGFYHDDWASIAGAAFHGSAFSLERLSWCVKLLLSRPITGLFIYLFSSIADKSPLFWQILMSFLSTIAVLTLAKALASLGRYLDFSTNREENLVFASLIVIFPWLLGGTIFVIAGLSVLLALIFFTLTVKYFFEYLEEGSSRAFFICILFYLISLLTYEAFYFQFLTLGTIGFCTSILKNRGRKRVLIIILFLGLIQVFAILWNRFFSPFAPSAKSFYIGWLQLFLYTTGVFVQRTLSNFVEIIYLVIIAIAGYIFMVVFLIRRYLAKRGRNIIFLGLVSLLGVMGTLISIWLYSIAGYGVAASGISSRMMLVPSFYLVIILFIFHQNAKIFRGEARLVFIISFGCLVGAIFTGYFFRFREWKTSWMIQRSVIAKAPVSKILSTDRKAVIIYLGPTQYGDVTVFQASWDIGGAINYSLFDTVLCRSYGDCNFRTFIVGRTDWKTTWDGSVLTQTAKGNGSVIWQGFVKEVWVWDYYSGTFNQVPVSAESNGSKIY